MAPMILLLMAPDIQAESGRADYDLDNDGLIEINDLADLNEIRNHLDGTALYGESTGCTGAGGCTGFELTSDLDFDTNGDGVLNAGDTYWNDGEGWEPLGDFSNRFIATFEGNGHVIYNLMINRSSGRYFGLFGFTDGATIQNLGLSGDSMSISGQYYQHYVGGLVGYVLSSTITNSYVTGAVSAEDYVGGLVGLASFSTIETSFATGTVIGGGDYVGGLVGFAQKSTINGSFATGAVPGGHFRVGGLVGFVQSSTINSSFATGAVNGFQYVGGLVGRAYDSANITNSFATGAVSGLYNVGGLVGLDYFTANITSSHWATDTSGQDTSAGGTSFTLAKLQCPTAPDDTACAEDGISILYATWDPTVWDFGTSNQLPGLVINGLVYRDGDADGQLDKKKLDDFNGDSKSDILIRNISTGHLYMYEMDANIRTGKNIGGLSTDWSVKGLGDFGADGKADILIRHTSGHLYMYEMDGNIRTGKNIGGLGTTWSVEGTGDFGGDGKDDILIRHSSGQLYMYEMDGNVRTGSNIG
ncbi:MAG: VCBS repeat-containing protein, partial [bacterium]|nr:VCBS repeat-containing protein [bacterium]